MFASVVEAGKGAMISLLNGRIASKGLDSVVVLVSGVGFEVRVTPGFADRVRLGDEITVYTSLVVREDSLSLVGFEKADERQAFDVLQMVSGIGPRIALAALAVLTPDDLRRAVRDSDLATLQRIPGIGKKSAQRMALEIGDKLGQPAHLDPGAATPAMGEVEAEVTTALVSLGWSQAQAAKAMEVLGGQGLGASDLLRAALVNLGGSRG